MTAKSSSFRRRAYEVTEEVLDPKTGELKRWIKKYSVRVRVDNFYLTYIDNLSGYLCLTSNTDKKVLAHLCTEAEYDTGRVNMSPIDRKCACDSLGICIQQFSNSISKLKALSLITGRNGFYMINPAVFWKGHSKTRYGLLNDNKIAVEFNFELEPEVSPEIKPNTDF